MTWVNCEPTKQEKQAYKALQKAAERIGMNNYKSQMAEHLKKKRSKKTFKFVVTEEHKQIVEAMPKVLKRKMTPEEAIGLLLYDYNIMKQRLGN